MYGNNYYKEIDEYLNRISNGLDNLGITNSNMYNFNKLNYRVSNTLVGTNQNINSNDIYHNISTIGGDIYNFDYTLTNNQLSITSSSNADILGGTGINTILIGGVDTNFNSIQEVITLNGTTQKLSTNNFQMVNSMSILSVGSYKKAVGNIYINSSNNSNQHCIIPQDGSGIFMGRYTIPNGYVGYLDTLNLSCTNGDQVEIATFIASPTFPLQQKSSILMYQNFFTTPSLSFTSLPSKYTIVYGAKRLNSVITKVSVNQKIKLVGNSEIT